MQSNSVKAANFSENLVVQHNDLITACYDLSVTEKKLLLGCICKINSKDKLTADKPFIFNLEEIAELFEIKYLSKQVYVEEFSKAARALKQKIVKIRNPENDNPNSYLEFTFAHTSSYNADKKEFKLYFSTGLLPYLSELHRNFTQYRLIHIGKMTSKYAIRIYELLVMWSGQDINTKNIKKMNLDELHNILDLPKVYRERFKDFRVAVIEPSINQINEKTDFNFNVEYHKTGRKVTAITFNFSQKAEWVQKEKDKKFNKKLTKQQIQTILNHPNFFKNYLYRYPGLGILEFLDIAKKELAKDLSKFPDYQKYLYLEQLNKK